jgi:hypothetical protein
MGPPTRGIVGASFIMDAATMKGRRIMHMHHKPQAILIIT